MFMIPDILVILFFIVLSINIFLSYAYEGKIIPFRDFPRFGYNDIIFIIIVMIISLFLFVVMFEYGLLLNILMLYILVLTIFLYNSVSPIFSLIYIVTPIIFMLFTFSHINYFQDIYKILLENTNISIIISFTSLMIVYLSLISNIKPGQIKRDNYLNSMIQEIIINDSGRKRDYEISIKNIETDINYISRFIPIIPIKGKSKIKFTLDYNIYEFILWELYENYPNILYKPIQKETINKDNNTIYEYTITINTVNKNNIKNEIYNIVMIAMDNQNKYKDKRRGNNGLRKIPLGIRVVMSNSGFMDKLITTINLFKLRLNKSYNYILYFDRNSDINRDHTYFVRDYLSNKYEYKSYDEIIKILDNSSEIKESSFLPNYGIDIEKENQNNKNSKQIFYLKINSIDTSSFYNNLSLSIDNKFCQQCLNNLKINKKQEINKTISGKYKLKTEIPVSNIREKEPIISDNTKPPQSSNSAELRYITVSDNNIFIHYRTDGYYFIFSPRPCDTNNNNMIDRFVLVLSLRVNNNYTENSSVFGHIIYYFPKKELEDDLVINTNPSISLTRDLKFY